MPDLRPPAQHAASIAVPRTTGSQPVMSRHAWAALVAVLVAVLVAYRDTAAAMVSIWARSETFAHAFLVPPIALWLIWRLRHALARVEPRPCWWMLLPIAALAAAWLLGDLASANSVSQLAMTGLLVLAVPAVLGLRMAGVIVFPLAFLFFAVPIGEFLLPQLMDWTADFTVLALRASGIPVFREGNRFSIPSGSWTVVEACSGVRYLIASLMVGTLFAYLQYRSMRRRLIFVAAAILVPIVANWVRAYLIVLLGHLSENRVAAGVDHLIYGWMFFGVVIGLMFMLGMWWHEPAAVVATQGTDAGARTRASARADAVWAAAVAVCVLILLPHMLLYRIGAATPARPVDQLARLDSLSGSWQPDAHRFTNWKPSYQRPSAEATSFFSAHGRVVGMYVGYYRDQSLERKLVSSDNQLVRPQDPRWVLTAPPEREEVRVGSEVVAVRSAALAGTDGPGLPQQRLRAWQLYWVADRFTSSDAWAKVLAAMDGLMARDDAAVIVVYTADDPAENARAVLADFLRTNLAAVRAQLRATRDGH